MLDAACEVSPFLLMRIVRGEKMEVNGRGGEALKERGPEDRLTSVLSHLTLLHKILSRFLLVDN